MGILVLRLEVGVLKHLLGATGAGSAGASSVPGGDEDLLLIDAFTGPSNERESG